MKRQFLMSFVMIGMVATLLGAGTLSYFSDIETSVGNTIMSGVINLKIGDNEGETVESVVNIEDMKPCKDFYVWKKITVEGNPADIWLHIKDIACTGGLHPESEWPEDPGNSINNIDDYITYDLYIDVDANGEINPEVDICIIHPDDHIKLGDIECLWIFIKGEVQGSIWIVQSFHMQAEVGNWAQGDICTFTEEFFANQIGAPDPTSNRILLENKNPADWTPILGDGIWGIAEYKVGSLDLDVEAHGLDANEDYQIKLTSPEVAAWYPVDASTRVKMASALASDQYTDPAGTAPPGGFNLFERGYYPSAAPNLGTTYAAGDVGVYAFTKHGATPNGVTTDATGYFLTSKSASLPTGEYSFIKIVISEDDSPWSTILMEKTQPMFFTIP
jgi:predicted ribosomally synthesized peptide with SipW-like signal peptide